jgi:ABC-type transporter Mla subunit MlaD
LIFFFFSSLMYKPKSKVEEDAAAQAQLAVINLGQLARALGETSGAKDIAKIASQFGSEDLTLADTNMALCELERSAASIARSSEEAIAALAGIDEVSATITELTASVERSGLSGSRPPSRVQSPAPQTESGLAGQATP